MDREELEKIRLLSKNALEGISQLKEEIENYKSGAESFREATGALEKLVRGQEKALKEIQRYVEAVAKINIEVEKIGEVDFREEGKEIRWEIRQAKREILEALEEERTEKKKRVRIFRRD